MLSDAPLEARPQPAPVGLARVEAVALPPRQHLAVGGEAVGAHRHRLELEGPAAVGVRHLAHDVLVEQRGQEWQRARQRRAEHADHVEERREARAKEGRREHHHAAGAHLHLPPRGRALQSHLVLHGEALIDDHEVPRRVLQELVVAHAAQRRDHERVAVERRVRFGEAEREELAVGPLLDDVPAHCVLPRLHHPLLDQRGRRHQHEAARAALARRQVARDTHKRCQSRQRLARAHGGRIGKAALPLRDAREHAIARGALVAPKRRHHLRHGETIEAALRRRRGRLRPACLRLARLRPPARRVAGVGGAGRSLGRRQFGRLV